MMQCPSDGGVLVVSRRGGVEIDSCPQCHGVWLDRGELDKIIARADPRTSPRFPPSMPPIQSRPAPADPAPRDTSEEAKVDEGTAAQPVPAKPGTGNWLADLFDDTRQGDDPRTAADAE